MKTVQKRELKLLKLNSSGQMVVELAALLPVMLILAALAINVLIYLGDCARFDRVAAEAVRVCGTSPGYGQYSASSCSGQIQEYIEGTFENADRLGFSVTSSEIGSLSGHDYGDSTGLLLSLIPTCRRYTCTMSYTPPMFKSGVFGAVFGSVKHECEYVVDPYQPLGFL